MPQTIQNDVTNYMLVIYTAWLLLLSFSRNYYIPEEKTGYGEQVM
jgi:hypothetical protein